MPAQSPPRYRLVAPPAAPVAAPRLSAEQGRVVAHRSGPLLVLAGPGTGKTTTLVESVVARIAAGEAPERVLVLTFSRKAAADLRRRIAARLGRTATAPLALTFHAFCFALLRRFAARESPDGPPPGAEAGLRLLTAPEQDFRIREALDGWGAERWPAELAAAFPTRGFAGEVRGVLARARQLGLEPEELAELGAEAERDAWATAGDFFEEYLRTLDFEHAVDYTELVHRVRLLLADPDTGPEIRAAFAHVYVDEYQDCDPAQVGLLRQLVRPGGNIVAVGDPDQSIYRFRGSEPRVIADFRERFAAAGEPVPVVLLRRTRRFGPAIAAAASRVAQRLPVVPGVDQATLEAFRRPEPEDRPGAVEAYTCDTEGAQAEHVADLLRRAHLHDGVPWGRMAVLVRSGRATIPGLARALAAAGVPVEVAGDEIPLAEELAVRPLLLALRVVADRLEGRRALDAETAHRLLLSPLGGLDSMGVRRLGRALRAAERRELAGAGLPQASAELIAQALSSPELLADCAATPEVERAASLASLLADVERQVAGGASAQDALWLVWRATDWPQALRRRAEGGGEPGRQADHDLDAICALFDLAARKETARTRGLRDLLADVASQQIPADTNREDDTRDAGVRLLTAHRAKGLEWDLVVVAGVQEGAWPDLRPRTGLLEAQRLTPVGIAEAEPFTVALAEERRLFYVACTRARSRLVVTAVAGTEGEGDQPSRFLAELGVPLVALPGRPRRPLTLTGLVAELRRTSVDPQATPELRHAAAVRLARLAAATDDRGRPLAPLADPRRWWGLATPTDAAVAVAVPGEPVRLTGSALEALLACPRQWYLEHQVHAERTRAGAQSLGSVIHLLAEHAEAGDWSADQMARHLDDVWDQLPFGAAWLSTSERVEAEAALERFAAWRTERAGRELLGAEVPFDVVVDVGSDQVQLTGKVDRLERDAEGRLRIVDLKTGRTVPTGKAAATLGQLGVYQLAAQAGAFDAVAGGDAAVGGAEAVYLRSQSGGSPWPKVLTQASLDDAPAPPEAGPVAGESWVHDRLAEAAAVVRAGEFPAVRCESCRFCAFASSCPVQGGRQVVS